MMKLEQHAKQATLALQKALRVDGQALNAASTQIVIEDVLRSALREHDRKTRKRLKAAQAAADSRIAHLLSSSPAVLYSFKASGDYAPLFVSDNIMNVFGYSPTEYLDNPSFWRERVHPDELTGVEEAIANFFRNGVHAVEYRFRKKDGSYCWVSDEQQLIRGRNGEPREIIGSWSDISARKAAEAAQAAAHARLARLLTSSPAVVYSYKAVGDFAPTFVSENIRHWLGYEPREYLEEPDFWRRCVHPDDLAAVEAGAAHLFKEGRHTDRISVPQKGRQLLLGCRRAASYAR